MNDGTLKLFHEMMKKGWIDRNENTLLWNHAEEPAVRDELDQMGKELGFDIVPAQDRIYLVPTQDNDLFLKNNVDFRSDVNASEARNRDLYLLNYLAIYLLFLFFKGEGNDAQVRDFITKEEWIREFTDHCQTVTREGVGDEDKSDDYSDNFLMLAEDWLSKKEGSEISRKLEDRYGIVNRILSKFRADDLFVESEGGKITPTKKTKDLMPYVLRKDRVQMINGWIEEENHASDQ